MGTNFYATTADGERLHLGKRSAGWAFAFQATEHFGTLRELVGWLETTSTVITDEYETEHDPVGFVTMATAWGPEGHTTTYPCWCGDNGDPHSPLDRWSLEYRTVGCYTDEASGTQWTRREFS